MMFEKNFFLVFFFSTIISTIILYIFKKNNLLIDRTSFSAHKKLINSTLKSPPLCGGFIVFICSVIFFQELILLNLFGFLTLILGVFSDSNKIPSPKIRILLQLVLLTAFVIFIENYEEVLSILKKNINNLNYSNFSSVIETDIFNQLIFKNLNSQFDIIFIDPPFKEKNLNKLLNEINISEILNKNGIIIIHRHKKEEDDLPNQFKIIEKKIYGISKIIFGRF